MPDRNFPPRWSVDELDSCFVVKDANDRNLMKAPTTGQVTAILPLRSWCTAAPESPASLTGRPVMPAPQSNLIAPWLRKAIQQTMVANARARPTSGQTRSNAVNTTPHPCFCRSPSGMLVITDQYDSCATGQGSDQHNPNRRDGNGRSGRGRAGRQSCTARRQCDGDRLSWARAGR